MNNTLPIWRDWMPSFFKGTILIPINVPGRGAVINSPSPQTTYEIRVKPLGFRGTWGLSWLLHLVPYLTGCKPRFRIEVKQTIPIAILPFSIELRRVGGGHDYLILKTPVMSDNYKVNFQHDEPITDSAKYSYILVVRRDGTSTGFTEHELVSFRTLWQENITMLVAGILLGFVVSLLTWIITGRR